MTSQRATDCCLMMGELPKELEVLLKEYYKIIDDGGTVLLWSCADGFLDIIEVLNMLITILLPNETLDQKI